jgi:hypothetical protein
VFELVDYILVTNQWYRESRSLALFSIRMSKWIYSYVGTANDSTVLWEMLFSIICEIAPRTLFPRLPPGDKIPTVNENNGENLIKPLPIKEHIFR